MDECGAPVVAIAGGEPLLHKEMPEIVEKILARGKIIILCTNALLLEKRIEQYKPHPRFTWDIHLDGDKEQHDWAVSQEGVYDRAVAALKLAKARGFRTAINATLFNNAEPERMAKFFDDVTAMGVDAIMVSPGYAYERAPDQQHFLNRSARPRSCSAASSRAARARGGRWAIRRCSSTSSPATRPTTARPGATRRATSSAGSGPATCWAKATPRPSPS